MSKLRPCLPNADPRTPCPRGGTAYLMIYNAVEAHDGLVHGKLHEDGDHCAVGCFFDVNPRLALDAGLIDEVAAMNDSMPGATMKQRRQRVLQWLRWRLERCGLKFPGRKPKTVPQIKAVA
jgi:hypothetical protein